MSATIRPATAKDAGILADLIRALADYEGLGAHCHTNADIILRDGFGDNPLFHALLAEKDGQAMGFALYYFTYSTFAARRVLHVEDLFLLDAARGQGAGRLMVTELARLAAVQDCHAIRLEVLDWNPTRGFYRHLGFAPHEGWLPYRLEGDALRRLAGIKDP